MVPDGRVKIQCDALVFVQVFVVCDEPVGYAGCHVLCKSGLYVSKVNS